MVNDTFSGTPVKAEHSFWAVENSGFKRKQVLPVLLDVS
jgi:hypothetical protein